MRVGGILYNESENNGIIFYSQSTFNAIRKATDKNPAMSIKSIMVVIACKAPLLGHIKVKYLVITDQEGRHYRGSDLQLDSPLQAAPVTGHTQHEPAPHL